MIFIKGLCKIMNNFMGILSQRRLLLWVGLGHMTVEGAAQKPNYLASKLRKGNCFHVFYA